MAKVTGQIDIEEGFVILCLDVKPPSITDFGKVRIEEKEFVRNVILDAPKCVAIEGTGNFEGKNVEFI